MLKYTGTTFLCCISGASGKCEGEHFSVGAAIHCAQGRAQQCPVTSRALARREEPTSLRSLEGAMNCYSYRDLANLADAPIREKNNA